MKHLKKFFGQARQRSGGNFYIDVTDIKATAETKNLHSLLKYDSAPKQSDDVACNSSASCSSELLNIADTEDMLISNDSIKHKVVFLAGYLEHKFQSILSLYEIEDLCDDLIDSAFLQNLNRGGLTIPKLSTVHFVNSVIQLSEIAIFTAVENI